MIRERLQDAARLTLLAATISLGLIASGSELEINGSDGDDRLVGTPGTDYFTGGPGADVFVINYLSPSADEVADFDPEDGDAIELTFDSVSSVPFRKENFSINRKGVVKIKLGTKEQEVVRLNRSDLRLDLDPRKGRYFLKFSKDI